MKRQFTGTCYLVHEDKFLLLFHPKHQKWLPPGGHLEEGETPPETARREVLEETGLLIEFYRDEHLFVEGPHARSIERPYLCLLEDIDARGDEPAHQHIDFIFVGYPVGGELTEGKWMTLEEVLALEAPLEIFPDTRETILTLAPKTAEIGRRAALQRGS